MTWPLSLYSLKLHKQFETLYHRIRLYPYISSYPYSVIIYGIYKENTKPPCFCNGKVISIRYDIRPSTLFDVLTCLFFQILLGPNVGMTGQNMSAEVPMPVLPGQQAAA